MVSLIATNIRNRRQHKGKKINIAPESKHTSPRSALSPPSTPTPQKSYTKFRNARTTFDQAGDYLCSRVHACANLVNCQMSSTCKCLQWQPYASFNNLNSGGYALCQFLFVTQGPMQKFINLGQTKIFFLGLGSKDPRWREFTLVQFPQLQLCCTCCEKPMRTCNFF